MSEYPDFSTHGYQVKKELGRNREAGRITYQAAALNLDLQVVIKEFRFALAGADWSGFKAYQREIEVLQQLDHPRIPRYLDSFETPQGFCLVQEYKNAFSLAVRRSFTPEDIQKIAVSVLEILVYLQCRVPPIIHRDIKPENILVDEQLNAYLVDFGFARIRGGQVALSSVAAGTPGFMPPEEQFGRPLTEASDLYSLGATLICLLTGTRSVDIGQLMDDNYRFDFKGKVPQLSPRFVQWLTKMVEPNLKNRYANAGSALEALKSIPVVGASKSRKTALFVGLATLNIISIIFLGRSWIFLKSEAPIQNIFSAGDKTPSSVSTAQLYKQANEQYYLGHYHKALTLYDQSLKINPDYSLGWVGRGWTLGQLERYEEALTAFDKALKMNPYSANSWQGRGWILGRLLRYEEALAAFDKSIEIDSEFYNAWEGKGYVLYYMQRYQEALASYNKALEINSDSNEAWEGRGWALGRLGQYKEALAAFDKSVEIDPEYVHAWDGRGRTLYQMQRYEEAVRSFDKALKIDPNFQGAIEGRRYAQSKLQQ